MIVGPAAKTRLGIRRQVVTDEIAERHDAKLPPSGKLQRLDQGVVVAKRRMAKRTTRNIRDVLTMLFHVARGFQLPVLVIARHLAAPQFPERLASHGLDEHGKLFKILPTEEIGVSLTAAFQLVPEQSTAAIVVHHPQATYFSIGGSARSRADADLASAVG